MDNIYIFVYYTSNYPRYRMKLTCITKVMAKPTSSGGNPECAITSGIAVDI